MDYKVLTKDNKNIFMPNDKIGINKNSKNQELSKSIVKSFLEQTISSDYITINKSSFINGLQIDNESISETQFNEENKHYIKRVVTDFDEHGNTLEFPEYWANDDDINRLVTEINKLNTEPEVNLVLLTEVSNQFKKIIDEELEIKKAVSNVIDNLEIYLSE